MPGEWGAPGQLCVSLHAFVRCLACAPLPPLYTGYTTTCTVAPLPPLQMPTVAHTRGPEAVGQLADGPTSTVAQFSHFPPVSTTGHQWGHSSASGRPIPCEYWKGLKTVGVTGALVEEELGVLNVSPSQRRKI